MAPSLRDILSLIEAIPRVRLKQLASPRKIFPYVRDFIEFRKQWPLPGEEFPLGKMYPCLDDRFSESGNAAGYYFHQDLLVARKVHTNQPAIHVDVGSRIDGLVAHIASFRPFKVFDIRSLSEKIPNVEFVQVDMMGALPTHFTEYCDSLSCLHALEHFGLGRYSDAVRWDGHLLGWENLYRLLKKGGKFYFSVPIGPQRIEFNAHRVFSLAYLLRLFSGKYEMDYFSYVDDGGNLHEDVTMTDGLVTDNFGCSYGCGIFELTKL